MKLNPRNNIVFNSLLSVLLGLLSWVVPKKKRFFLLGAGNGSRFQGNTKSFYLYLEKHNTEKVTFLWTTKNRELYEELKHAGRPVVSMYTLAGFWAVLRASHLVFEIGSRDLSYEAFLFGRFNKIQLCHGIDLKKVSIDTHDNSTLPKRIRNSFEKMEYATYDLVLSISPKCDRLLYNAFHNRNIINLGYPRDDIFVYPETAVVDYRDKLGLDRFDRVVLYAPTYRAYGDEITALSEQGLDRLNDIMVKKNAVFLLKKHIYSRSIVLNKDYSNIKDVSLEVEDIQELLLHVDLLISDYSSVCFDFLMTDNPSIYYIYDFEQYNRNVGLNFDYEKEIPGPVVRTEDELLNTVESFGTWNREEKYISSFKKFQKDNLTWRDGKSCERLYETLLKR